MGLRATMTGRKAYQAHVAGMRLDDQGKYQEAQKKFDEAIALYGQAVAMGDQETRHMMSYSVLLLRTGQFEKAREIMLATEKRPGLTANERKQLTLNFAICQWKRGKLDNAIELMRRAGSDGMTATIYGSLGYMLIEKAAETGDYAEAIAFNQEAYEYDDEDAVTLDNLGQLALQMGKRDEAKAYFERAIKIKPTQVDTLYYLGKLAHEDADDDLARQYLSRALGGRYSALCTTSREQAEALRQTLA